MNANIFNNYLLFIKGNRFCFSFYKQIFCLNIYCVSLICIVNETE